MSKILIIEPFYGGSHKQMIDLITSALQDGEYELITMSAKKWHWRARCSSLYVSQQLPDLKYFKTLFCSSVLNLTELIGLCPKLANLKKVIYFHENQLVYPVQVTKNRDYQYGYNQITSCLAADIVVFNSNFNMTSFLGSINKFMKLQPDYRPKDISKKIEKKSIVIYYPVCFDSIDNLKALRSPKDNEGILHIVWAHRWEFDKNPSLILDVLQMLVIQNVNFEVSLMGESFSEIPENFNLSKEQLKKNIRNFGFVESREDFFKIMLDADIAVSTADHEFFGVSMLEGTRCGCVPLAPNKLVYPELYPKDCLFDSKEELFNRLKNWCNQPKSFIEFKKKLNNFELTEKFNATNIMPQLLAILKSN